MGQNQSFLNKKYTKTAFSGDLAPRHVRGHTENQCFNAKSRPSGEAPKNPEMSGILGVVKSIMAKVFSHGKVIFFRD